MSEQEIVEIKARIYDLSVEINNLAVRQQALLAEIERLKAQLAEAEWSPAQPAAVDRAENPF